MPGKLAALAKGAPYLIRNHMATWNFGLRTDAPRPKSFSANFAETIAVPPQEAPRPSGETKAATLEKLTAGRPGCLRKHRQRLTFDGVCAAEFRRPLRARNFL